MVHSYAFLCPYIKSTSMAKHCCLKVAAPTRFKLEIKTHQHTFYKINNSCFIKCARSYRIKLILQFHFIFELIYTENNSCLNVSRHPNNHTK